MYVKLLHNGHRLQLVGILMGAHNDLTLSGNFVNNSGFNRKWLEAVKCGVAWRNKLVGTSFRTKSPFR